MKINVVRSSWIRIIKNKFWKKKKISSLSHKSGVAVAETILLIGISLVIISVVFYPNLKTLIGNAFSNLEDWFNQAVATIGVV